jgi:acyl-CoA thioester hydrolase
VSDAGDGGDGGDAGSDAGPAPRFARTFRVGWASLDPNAHVRNTAYLDLAVDARLAYFAEHGVPLADFQRLGVGPVARRDELEYFRELHHGEAVTVTLVLTAASADGARFALVNEVHRGELAADAAGADTLAARVTTFGGWLSLATRRLTPPPAPLLAALRAMPRAAGFAELPPLRPGAASPGR